MATLDGNDLGHVSSEGHSKTSDLQDMRMPLSDSNAALVFDFAGALRRITVSGVYADTSIANVHTNFIGVIEAIVSGNQSTAVTYVSDTAQSYSVYVDSFNWSWVIGEILMVKYTIILLEGT